MGKRILFVAEGVTLAHPVRMVALAKEIALQLHPHDEIHFAFPNNYLALLKVDVNFWHELNSLNTRLFNERLYKTKFPYTQEEIKRYYQEDIELIEAVKPDLVIEDYRLTMPLYCHKRGIPCVNCVNYHWSSYYQRPLFVPFVHGLDIWGRKFYERINNVALPLISYSQKQRVNGYLCDLGYPPVSSIFDLYRLGDYNLFPDVPDLYDVDSKQFRARDLFCGPLWGDLEVPLPKWINDLPKNKKIIFISLGSSGRYDKIQFIVEGLIKRDYAVVLSTAGGQWSGGKWKDFYWAAYLPLNKMLEMSDLVLCNGGTMVTYEALMHQVPVFALPINLDQYLHMDRIKAKGLGDYEHFDKVKTGRLFDKIETLLKAPPTDQLKAFKTKIIQEKSNFADSGFMKRILG